MIGTFDHCKADRDLAAIVDLKVDMLQLAFTIVTANAAIAFGLLRVLLP